MSHLVGDIGHVRLLRRIEVGHQLRADDSAAARHGRRGARALFLQVGWVMEALYLHLFRVKYSVFLLQNRAVPPDDRFQGDLGRRRRRQLARRVPLHLGAVLPPLKETNAQRF